MKKVYAILCCLFLAVCLPVLAGCQGMPDENTADLGMTDSDITDEAINDYFSQMETLQEIKISPVDASHASQTLRSEEDILEFVNTLKIEKWQPARLPGDLEKSGIFTFSRQETQQLGQDESNLGSEDVMELYAYRGASYVTLQVGGISLDFSVPKAAGEYLNGLL